MKDVSINVRMADKNGNLEITVYRWETGKPTPTMVRESLIMGGANLMEEETDTYSLIHQVFLSLA